MLKRLKSWMANYLLSRRSYRFFIREWLELGDLGRAADAMQTMRFSRMLQAEVASAVGLPRIAVLAPHPDDEAIGPGGTLIEAKEKGSDILIVTLTTASDGGALRKAESIAVAKSLGFDSRFLDWSEGAIPVDVDERAADLAVLLGAFKPDAIFVPFFLDDHPDHRRASQLLAALAPHLSPRLEVWAYQVYSVLPPNVIVDITATAERKAAAIRLYASQMKHRDWSHFALGLNAFMSRFLPAGPRARYAEAFFVLPLAEYAELCDAYFQKP